VSLRPANATFPQGIYKEHAYGAAQNNQMRSHLSRSIKQIVSFTVLGLAVLTPGQAGLITDAAIEFSKSDVGGAKSAQKPWVINAPGGEPTKVWSVQNASVDDSTGDARIKIGSTSQPNSEVVWKIVAPEGSGVSDFQWAVNAVFLQGTPNADIYFLWEYSADGTNWHQLFSRQNLRTGETGPVSIRKEMYSGQFSKPYPQSFYIRARNNEEMQSGEKSYYAIFSTFPDGGESEESFVSINVDRN